MPDVTASEHHYRQLAESIREVFWMTDPAKNQIVYVSPGYEAIWGRTCESLYASPRDWIEAIHPDDRQRVLEAALTKQMSGQYDEVYRIVRGDGSVRWIQDRAFPIRDDSGKVSRIAGLAEDITGRKLTERRLAAQYGIIRALAESATLGEGTTAILKSVCEWLGWEMGALWEVQRENKVLRCFDLWCVPAIAHQEFVTVSRSRTFGRGEGLPGRVWFHARSVWIPDMLAESNFPRAPLAARCGLHGAFGFPILLRNQVIGVIEFFSREVREPDKPVLEMMSALGGQIGQFIARKQAEEALRKAEASYRSIYENAAEGIFQTTPEGRYRSANPALARMLGYSSSAELVESVTDIGKQICVRPESRVELKQRLARDGYIRDFENQIYRKDGSIIWASVNARIVRDAQGAVLYFEGTSQDITQRKQAEIQVATLAHAVESSSEMICITDVQDRFTFVNRAFLLTYGYTEAEILGKTPDILFSPKNPEPLMREILEKTRLGGWRGEVLDRRKDGTEFPVLLSTSQIKDGAGRVVGLMGVAQDITARKRAEKQTAAFSLLGYHLSAVTVPEQAANIIFEIASNLFGWDAGYVHLYSQAEDKIVPILTLDTVNGQRIPVPETSFTLEPSPLMRLVMREGARLLNHSEDAALAAALVPFGDTARRSACKMYVPIHSRGEALGILSIQSYTPKAYSQDDLILLQALANHCGDALRRIEVAEALREAEARYRGIFENATEGIFQTSADGRYLNANPALARMFGYQSPAELISSVTNIERQTFVSAESASELKRLLAAQDSVLGFEAERYRKDGGKFWTSINVRAVREDTGGLRYYEGTTLEITGRKRAETVLRESEEKFRTLFESARVGIALHDAKGRFVNTNPAYQRMLGYEEEELRQLGVKRITHPEDILEGQRLFEELRESKREHYQREKRYLRKDGEVVWAQASASAVRDGNGQLQYIISMVEDITERRQAQEALRQSERKLRLIAENTTDVIFAFDMERRPVYINPAVKELTGYTFGEIQERKFINWIHPEDQKRMLNLWEELYGGKGYSEVEFRLITKAGQIKWCASTWGPLLDENGRQIGVQGRERDITELKRADAARRELAAIVENSASAIISVGLDGLVVSWNKAAERIFGYTVEELVGEPLSVLFPAGRPDEFAEMLPDLLQGKRIEGFETLRRRKDGSLVELLLTISPTRDAAGKVSGASAIAQDITERKRLEKELLEMSSKERRSLGHELHDGLGQYLAGVALKTKALEEDLAAEGSVHDNKAKALVKLMNDAIRQTRRLAQGLDPVHVEADGLVAALANLAVQTEDLFHVECAFACKHERLDVNAQTSLALYRITQEALHNAVKHGKARRLQVELALDESHLSVRIQDNGKGIKPKSKPTAGLGLRTMRYRANSIGATLLTHSDPKTGTKIECLVPKKLSLTESSP